MIKKIANLLSLLLLSFLLHAQEVPLKKGMVIKKNTKIKKGTYLLKASDLLTNGVIIIEGNNITVDFNNAILKGSDLVQKPDAFKGLAVFIRKGKNITIKNLNASGYKVALLARNIEGLTIENCNFSYNYRQHLNSSQVKEDISDWMSYHHNEKDEWLRYGAAIYLRNCDKATISNNTVTGGQNALMITESDGGLIYNNNFSFNSGIGIGMYRSGNNKVLYNILRFNVRGYSHGVYNRGQDSAGILVYEQSSNNLFYKNLATHSGDGFFLWAGQYTMDTGEGGCNDNVLMQNDFSYAPTNGIEVTFSRNKIIKNRIFECDHGIWGGYSYNTLVDGNQFRDNRIAIAIEHGQENIIHNNLFSNDRTAIKLWARSSQPADWGYAKARDTRSRNYVIAVNSFNRNRIVYDFTMTDSIAEFGNEYHQVDTIFKADESMLNVLTENNADALEQLAEPYMPELPGNIQTIDPFRGSAKYAGRKNIMMTEWGPYDFTYPLLWNTNPTGKTDSMAFEVHGPKGQWKIISLKGVEQLSKTTDSFPSFFHVKKTAKDLTDIEIIAEYTGPAFTDRFGRKMAAGKTHRFVYHSFFQPVNFIVNWYAFDAATNPLTGKASVPSLRQTKPFQTDSLNKLDFAWWGGIKKGNVQHKQFLTVAEGTADIAPGNYELGVTWDDAVRVYVDGKLVLDEWNPSKYTFDESPHKKIRLKLGGKHRIKVEHVELGGFATLSLKLRKADQN